MFGFFEAFLVLLSNRMGRVWDVPSPGGAAGVGPVERGWGRKAVAAGLPEGPETHRYALARIGQRGAVRISRIEWMATGGHGGALWEAALR